MELYIYDMKIKVNYEERKVGLQDQEQKTVEDHNGEERNIFSPM